MSAVIQKEELIMLVDFGDRDKDGLLLASLRHTIGLRKPRVGDWVRLDDTEGRSCRGRIASIKDGATTKGGAIKVAPEWDTMTIYVPQQPEFTVSHEGHWVQGSAPSPHRTVGSRLSGSLA
jgi:hypothetical protein